MIHRRNSEIRGRKLTAAEAVIERIATSSLGYQLLLKVAPRIDRWLIPMTDGHWSSGGRDQIGMLTSTGAKSGAERSQPLLCIQDGDGFLVIGSNYGRPPHPGWSANLRKQPECNLLFGGRDRRYRARELAGEERAAAWKRAVDWYAGYAIYEEKCRQRRTIRVFRLEPVER